MTFRILIRTLAVMAIVVLAPARSEALSFTVDDFTVIAGQSANVTATVQWEVGDPDPLSLDGFNVMVAPGLIVDPTPFFATWPLNLGAGGSFAGVLFTVTALLATPAGMTGGTATFFASGAGVPIDDATDAFTVTVGPVGNAVPEPTSLLLLGTGAFGMLARVRRRKQP